MLGYNKLLRDISGSVLVETTVVLPLFLLLALGTVDVSYMFFEWGLANKAAYVGARTAIVSNPVASNIVSSTLFTITNPQQIAKPCFVLATGLPNQDPNNNNNNYCPAINATCVSGSCGTGNTYSGPDFNYIVGSMQNVFPRIAASNVQITYSNVDNSGVINSGLGQVGQLYTGNATNCGTACKYVLPANVTVSVIGMTHRFFFVQGLLNFFGGAFSATAIPQFSTTLQSESMYTQ